MSKEIKLSKGKVAIVDEEDFERLSSNKWYAEYIGGNWYAKRTVRISEPKRTSVYMHRVVLGVDGNIDHIDGDGLNNCKVNLREVTKGQNNRNRKPYVGKTSRYKGVSFNSKRSKWQAQIKKNRRNTTIGVFDTEEEAAIAYNERAHELFGEYAYLNQIS